MSGRKSSFYWAMCLLGRRRRQAMFALYAFCRVVDDIADEGELSPAERLALLAGWRAELSALYDGKPSHPIAQALAGPVAEFSLDQSDLLAIIDGMAMDAEGLMRRPSTECLDLYCDRVAAAVGRLSMRVFGLEGAEMTALASHLGSALQRTNILRDLAEDGARGRLYLPDSLLAAAGIAGDDPQQVLSHPRLPQVCAALAAEARRDFAASWRIMDKRRCRILRTVGLMAAVYACQLDRLEAAGWKAVSRLSLFNKLRLTIRWMVHPTPWNKVG